MPGSFSEKAGRLCLGRQSPDVQRSLPCPNGCRRFDQECIPNLLRADNAWAPRQSLSRKLNYLAGIACSARLCGIAAGHSGWGLESQSVPSHTSKQRGMLCASLEGVAKTVILITNSWKKMLDHPPPRTRQLPTTKWWWTLQLHRDEAVSPNSSHWE